MATCIEATAGAALTEVGERSDELAATAGSMRSVADRTGVSAQAAAAAAGQALATTQIVASAAQELAASIMSISSQVNSSAAIVVRAVAAGDETRAAIDALNQEVGRIGAVADMIGDVTARTNLLALNATIEAARAGEAGKGCAVVASEVKHLAAQTACSTREISRHIDAVRAATRVALGAVNHMKATISEIGAVSGSIAEAVQQQSAATAEIARSFGETAAAVSEMNERNVEVSAEAGRAGEYAETVLASTRGLAAAVNDLKTAVIRTVRTSSQEVDRRLSARNQVDLIGRVSIKRQPAHLVRILDISEGGMRFTGCSGLPVGQRGAIRVDSIGMPIHFSVATHDGDQTGIRLDADPPVVIALRAMLANQPQRAAG